MTYRIIDGHHVPYSLAVQRRIKGGVWQSPKRLSAAAYLFARRWLAECKPGMGPLRIEGAYLYCGAPAQAGGTDEA